MDRKPLVYEVDYMKLLYENRNISVYDLDAIHLGWNSNNVIIDEESVKNSIASFADVPIYGIIDNQYNPLDGAHNDFLEHFREEYPWLATRDRIIPFGTIPESAVKAAKFVERDGKTYLRLQAIVWKRLLPHISEILQRRDGDVKVSVEFDIEDGIQNPDTGAVKVVKFCITAVTVLGAKYQEVMKGAMLKSVRFSYDNYFKTCNSNYFSFMNQKEYDIPNELLSNIKSGLESVKNNINFSGNSITTNVYNAMKISSESGKLLESQADDMKKFFDSNKSVGRSSRVTSRSILFAIYGGEDGRNWINQVYNSESAGVIGVKNAEKITIDNSKSSAVHSSSWSNPGKSLYGKLLEASNVESLVKEAYLIVENGYKDAPSEKLKYPHHVVKDGKLVLNVKGVEAALARAKQTGVFDQVKAHLKRHYTELGLPMEAFEKEDSGKMADIKNGHGPDCECDECKMAKFSALEEKCAEYETKCADLEAKCAEFEAKCGEANTKCSELETKCADLEAKCAEFQRKEDTTANMAYLSKFSHCLDEDCMNSMKENAEKMSCDEFKNSVANAVMSFAESLKDAKKCDMFAENIRNSSGLKDNSYTVNPFFNANKGVQNDDESSLEKVINRSKTKVI